AAEFDGAHLLAVNPAPDRGLADAHHGGGLLHSEGQAVGKVVVRDAHCQIPFPLRRAWLVAQIRLRLMPATFVSALRRCASGAQSSDHAGGGRSWRAQSPWWSVLCLPTFPEPAGLQGAG